MFGSAILEVAIGMILIYLVLSLIMTSVQEAIHAIGKTRARNLQQALLELLQGDETLRNQFYDHPLIYALHRGTPGASHSEDAHLPSYIPRETFSAAFIDVMEREEALEASLPPPLRAAYDGLKRAAASRANDVRGEIERWYDAAMDRASGRFKRKSQSTLFLLSLGLALLLNVNSITLAQYLAVSPQQRELLAGYAEQTWQSQQSQQEQPGKPAQPAGTAGAAAGGADGDGADEPTPPAQAGVTRAQLNELTEDLNAIGLPIGWRETSVQWITRGFPEGSVAPVSISALLAWILLIAGYLMTAFAITLGAPFWFDVLNKFMVIRGTVKPREKSQDEASEDRQPPRNPIAVPPPAGS